MVTTGLLVASLVAFGLLVAALVYFGNAAEKRRRGEVRRRARRLGLSYQEKADLPPTDGIGRFRLFNHGHSRAVRNKMDRSEGVGGLSVFEYAYTVGSGQHQSRLSQTVAAVRRPGASWPQCTLHPEHLFHRIGAFFGAADIDFDGNPEFSRAYVLKGQDEGVVRSLFSPDATHWLSRNKGWSLEAQGEDLVAYRAGRRVRPDNLASFIADVESLVETLV